LHREWAKEQLAAGEVIQAGKWGDHGGIIIVKVETRGELIEWSTRTRSSRLT
jgi:hypothetical protein